MQLVHPLVAPGECAPPRLPDERTQRLPAVRHDADVDVANSSDLLTLDVDLDDLRLARDDGFTAARKHPEPSAEEEGGVGEASQGHAASGNHEASDAQRAVLGDGAAGHSVGAHGDTGEFGELPQLVGSAREPHAAPGQDDRPLGLRQDGQRLVNGFGRRRRRRFRPIDLREAHLLFLHAGSQHVFGYLQEHGARPAGSGLTERHTHILRYALRIPDQASPFGDGLHEGHPVQLLEGHHLIIGEGVAPAHDDHGHGVDVCVGDGSDDIGDARASGHYGDAGLPRGTGPGVSHVPSRLLVAGIDDSDAVVATGLKDGVDVPAVEAEDALHPLPFQHGREHLAAIDLHDWLLSGPLGRNLPRRQERNCRGLLIVKGGRALARPYLAEAFLAFRARFALPLEWSAQYWALASPAGATGFSHPSTAQIRSGPCTVFLSASRFSDAVNIGTSS